MATLVRQLPSESGRVSCFSAFDRAAGSYLVANLDLVQIHGNFNEDLLTEIGRPVIRVSGQGSLKKMSANKRTALMHLLLVVVRP